MSEKQYPLIDFKDASSTCPQAGDYMGKDRAVFYLEDGTYYMQIIGEEEVIDINPARIFALFKNVNLSFIFDVAVRADRIAGIVRNPGNSIEEIMKCLKEPPQDSC